MKAEMHKCHICAEDLALSHACFLIGSSITVGLGFAVINASGSFTPFSPFKGLPKFHIIFDFGSLHLYLPVSERSLMTVMLGSFL